jgi:hypothetical protein
MKKRAASTPRLSPKPVLKPASPNQPPAEASAPPVPKR